MYAVIATGGKQLKVKEDDIVVVEKLKAEVGDELELDVLFLANEDEAVFDKDALADAIVKVEVLEHFKGDKVTIFKFKKRKGYKRTQGHRQELTRVKVKEVRQG